jgi:membrane-associated phospholipid phosphatase
MEAWVQNGLDLVIRVQSLGLWLRDPMLFFTFLGSEPFYMLIMPALLWCYDAGLGLRVGLVLIGSLNVNAVLKLAFQLPRPYWVSSAVQPFSTETSFGLPSGHAQDGVAVWGRLAASIGSRRAQVGAAVLVLLISVSRLYLGVHFPLDLAAGWVVGLLLLAIFLRFEQPVWWRVKRWAPGWQIALALVASLAFAALGASAIAAHQASALPASWLDAMAASQLTDVLVDPRGLDGVVTASGTLFGFAAGGILLVRWGGFNAKGRWPHRLARYAVGAFGVALLMLVLGLVDLSAGSPIDLAWRFLRYGLIGLWISYFAPRTFKLLGLVEESA